MSRDLLSSRYFQWFVGSQANLTIPRVRKWKQTGTGYNDS